MLGKIARSEIGWLAALAGFMALAGAVRLVGVESKPLTNDEAYSWRISQYAPGELVYRTRWDANPPLYYLVLQGWEQVWGTSPLALRGLSVLLGVLIVPLSYAACRQAVKLGWQAWGKQLACPPSTPSEPTESRDRPRQASCLPHGAGGLLAAFLVAVHPAQVVAGQTARMYELGVFLAALSSWLLLKALGHYREPVWWWAGYGIAAAACAYTHNYGLFAVAAQGLFALVFLVVRGTKEGWQAVRGPAGWLAFAALLGGILYAPWLPVLLGQTGDVREGFWIPQVSFDELQRVFWPWCTGLSYLDSLEKCAWLIVLAVCLGWTFYARSVAGWFFLLQAALPWVFSVGLSLYWQRSIFQDRYLTFAQWALMCYFGTICWQLPGWPLRLFLTCFIGLSTAWHLSWQAPEGPPALAQAAAFLKEHYQPGDPVWVQGAAEVNRFRYYASQQGISELAVKCPVHFAGHKGHIVHLASLSGEDILESWALEKPPRRFWQAGDGMLAYAPAGTKKVLEATFRDGTSQYALALYERHAKLAERKE